MNDSNLVPDEGKREILDTNSREDNRVYNLPREHPMSGTEVKQQTWSEVAEELKSRLEKQMASGDPATAKNAHDLYVLLHLALGLHDEVAKDHVILTASGEKKQTIAELEKKLAEARAA